MVFKNQIWQPVISFEARSICAWECLLPFSPVSMFLTARWLKTSCQEEGKKIVFKANLAFSIFTMWQMISVADISLRLVLSLLVLFVQLWGCDCIIDVSYGSGLKRKEWSLRKVQTYLQIRHDDKKNVLILCLCGKREVLCFFLSLSVTIKL